MGNREVGEQDHGREGGRAAADKRARMEAVRASERRAERGDEAREVEMKAERRERAAHSSDKLSRLRAEGEGERRERHEGAQMRHEANYRELAEKVVKGQVEWADAAESHVSVEDILEPERAGERLHMEDPNFWTHHGNTPEFYRTMAEKYPELRRRVESGETLDAIKSDERMRVATEFWYGADPVKLEKYKGSYIVEKGYHRYALGRRFNLGEIPARVSEARDRQ